jgi:hypothetical protein
LVVEVEVAPPIQDFQVLEAVEVMAYSGLNKDTLAVVVVEAGTAIMSVLMAVMADVVVVAMPLIVLTPQTEHPELLVPVAAVVLIGATEELLIMVVVAVMELLL